MTMPRATVIARTTLGVVVPVTVDVGPAWGGVKTIPQAERLKMIAHARYVADRVRDVAGVQIDLTIVEPETFTAHIKATAPGFVDTLAMTLEFARVGLTSNVVDLKIVFLPNGGYTAYAGGFNYGVAYAATINNLYSAGGVAQVDAGQFGEQGATFAHEWLHGIETRLGRAGVATGYGKTVPLVHDGATGDGAHRPQYPENVRHRDEWAYLEDLMTARVPKPGGGTYGITPVLWRSILTPVYAPSVPSGIPSNGPGSRPPREITPTSPPSPGTPGTPGVPTVPAVPPRPTVPLIIPAAPAPAPMRSIGHMDNRLYVVTRDNEFVRDISDLLITGKVLMNQDIRVPMSFSATLREPDAVRPFTEYLAPHLRVVYDTGEVVEGQAGLYAVLPPGRQTHRWDGSRAEVTGHDLTSRLGTFSFGRPYTVAAGTDVYQAVLKLLIDAGYTRHRIPPPDASRRRRMTDARTWRTGITALDIVNELLGLLRYYPLWPDPTGTLTSRAYGDLRAETPVKTIASGFGTELVGDVEETAPQTPFYNRVTVVKESAGGPAAVSGRAVSVTVTNDDPASPTSTVNTGGVIARPIVYDSTLADEAAVRALAERLLQESQSWYRVLKVRALPDPRHDLHEVWALNVANRRGDLIATGRWRCPSYELGFTPADGLLTATLAHLEDGQYAS